MSEVEIGLEEARKMLGDLANRARFTRQVTYLTRNRTRVAVIISVEQFTELLTRAGVGASDVAWEDS